ncbi:zinc finger protein 385A isoform X2 [Bombina bombina]|nr:zinc finger protein 385A isoform X2 [Bombina bombina]XP_053564249.1 zinc finger protein 385A isoform X2 [Bombina bombina]XP_053564250.1 zinc finger protein 385A isoform X2 [Bombina bombina]
MVQRPLHIKPFLSFPVEPQPALGLFPAFRTMDHVQKAVMSPNFGVPIIKTRRPVISCNVCQIRFNSGNQAEAHYKGNRHARRVKGIENAKSRQKEGGQEGERSSEQEGERSSGQEGDRSSGQEGDRSTPMISPVPSVSESDSDCKDQQCSDMDVPSVESLETLTSILNSDSTSPPSTDAAGNDAKSPTPSAPASSGTDGEDSKKQLYCALCKVSVNSTSQLEAHNKGTKHKTILEARSGLGPIKAYPRLGGLSSCSNGPSDSNSQERTFHCEICNVRVTSEGQLKQHISSRRHRDGVSGKPNPLLSRHKKQQNFHELTAGLVFPKGLTKSLSAGLLPSPFAVAMAAASVRSPLSLHPAPTPPLLQTPPITHHLLRPAPGPIRTAHGTILFSPY